MKFGQSRHLILALAACFVSGAAVAGTAGISGQFYGSDVTLNVRSYGPLPADVNVLQGIGTGSTWTWNFNGSGGTVTITNGQLTPQTSAGGPFDYRVKSVGALSTVLPIVDNGDGTYNVTYNFQVDYPGGTRSVNTYAPLEITYAGGQITVKTLDPDSDGIAGVQIPASSSTPPFPKDIEQEWVGTADPV